MEDRRTSPTDTTGLLNSKETTSGEFRACRASTRHIDLL